MLYQAFVWSYQSVFCRMSVTVGCYTSLSRVNHCGGVLLMVCCCIVIKGIFSCSDLYKDSRALLHTCSPFEGNAKRLSTPQLSMYLCVNLIFLFFFFFLNCELYLYTQLGALCRHCMNHGLIILWKYCLVNLLLF